MYEQFIFFHNHKPNMFQFGIADFIFFLLLDVQDVIIKLCDTSTTMEKHDIPYAITLKSFTDHLSHRCFILKDIELNIFDAPLSKLTMNNSYIESIRSKSIFDKQS